MQDDLTIPTGSEGLVHEMRKPRNTINRLTAADLIAQLTRRP
jgi:hypothetical protein